MDPYAILGLRRDATKATIKAVFRKLAKTAHPDHGGDAEIFARLKLAYDVLVDDARRSVYDQTGECGEKPVDNADSDALVMISIAFNHVMGDLAKGGCNPREFPMVDRLRHKLTQLKAEREKERQATRKQRALLVDLMERFTSEKGEPVVVAMMRGQIAQMDGNLSGLDRYEKASLRALEMMNDWRFRQDGSTGYGAMMGDRPGGMMSVKELLYGVGRDAL